MISTRCPCTLPTSAEASVQGFLTYKKTHPSLGIGLRQDSRRVRFFVSEVPLYPPDER